VSHAGAGQNFWETKKLALSSWQKRKVAAAIMPYAPVRPVPRCARETEARGGRAASGLDEMRALCAPLLADYQVW